ncbi:TonB family protein [Granulicella sp. S156]|jgi:TonB family protein|uniref:M56 family metallopeptidase n=1 Tax=Granulicella sp. S156 TaxID=1747224 RepID=UPI0020B11B88|nr:M56 family metallopeptidase [Granulicella sp. S156]
MKDLEAWILSYLLNSAWQVPLIFAAAWVATRAVRRSGVAMQHRIWVSALVLETFLPACSVQPVQLLREMWQLLLRVWGSEATNGRGRVAVVFGDGYGHGALKLPLELLAGITIVYGGIVVYFAGRLGWRLLRTDLLRRQAERLALTGEASRSWERYCRVFGVYDAAIAVASDVSGPITMGIRRRTILLPMELQMSLSDEDFDAVIAHEFAHMRRWDFAKNLLYEALSLPIAYHPLLWLTRARIAESREIVCDAMAAEAVAGREKYARSLLRLASMLVQGTPDRTLHAIGIFDANIFERRVMSLTEKSMQVRGARRIATVAACVVFGLGTCASALALRMEVSSPAVQDGGQSASGARVRISAGVMAVNILNKVAPVYPQEARDAGISGTVVLHAIIGKDGSIQALQLVSGPKELAPAAYDAVKQWTYKPYLLNGEPTEVDTTIMVNFNLNGSTPEPGSAPNQ